MQVLGFTAAFATLLYLSVRKVELYKVMLLATAILALTSGFGLSTVLSTAVEAFLDPATLELSGTVLAIGVFSTLMQEFGFLEKTVDGLRVFLGNVKAAIISVPALIGSMPVLGGAALSAPLVDRLGDSLDLSPGTKAAANLAFRHGMFFIFPFSPGLILTSKITGYSIGTLIARLWPMSVAIWAIGYMALLRKAKPTATESVSDSAREIAATALASTEPPSQNRREALRQFLEYGSPLLLALLLSLVFSLPLWISLLAGSMLAVVLAKAKSRSLPKWPKLVEGANLPQVMSMFFIMSFKAFVTLSPVFPALIAQATEKGVSPALMGLALPLALGYGSASQTATVGILVPLLAPASFEATARLYLVCLIYVSSFTAYLFSPLHMCQVLTCEYFGIGIAEVYKKNWPILVGFLIIMAVFYFLVGSLLAVS